MDMVLKKIKKNRNRLIFAALFWITAIWCYQAFLPAAKETAQTRQLLMAHSNSLSKLNAFLSFENCSKSFSQNPLLEKIASIHKKTGSLSSLDFIKVYELPNILFTKVVFASNAPEIEKKVVSQGHLFANPTGDNCFGFVR